MQGLALLGMAFAAAFTFAPSDTWRVLTVIANLFYVATLAFKITLLKAGRVNGLSFGYRVARSDGQAPRVLKDLDLIEVSLVTFPMQPGARVHAVSVE
ncbi:MAG: hypothetical protein B7Z20_11595 [Sphingobium sp. 32-64-5]|nr:MAG: hypothetical protein B7Z20_11595 [Sphingobium sp. 32-64-5]